MRSVLVLAAFFSSIAASAADGQESLGPRPAISAGVTTEEFGACDPGSGTAWFNRIAACTDLIRIGGGTYAVYLARASAYADSGDRVAAIADLSAAILLSPDGAAAYALRGALYLKDESFRDGLVDLDRALALNPDDEVSLRTRAFAWDELGNYPSAIADYTALLALSGDDSYRYFRGFAHLRHGEQAEAVADFEAILNSPSPTLASWGYRGRGTANEKAGEFTAALADYNAALTLDPTDDRAYVGRCRVEMALGSATQPGCSTALVAAAAR